MNHKNLLEIYLEVWGIHLTEYQLQQFEKFYELLIEKNKVMNLTAITDYKEVVLKHFVDSISIILLSDFQTDKKIIDVGTGAGFPGIPLKIAFPDLEVVLLDSLNKRVRFLNDVIEELQLKGIEAIHGRAEDMGHLDKYRERFDYAVSRAVANLSTLSEYCIPFVKEKGYFVSYKSEKLEEELPRAKQAIRILGASFEESLTFELPNTEIKRKLVIIRKTKTTAEKYPRKAGLPGKEPL